MLTDEDKAWIREIIYQSEVRIISAFQPWTLEALQRTHAEIARKLDGMPALEKDESGDE